MFDLNSLLPFIADAAEAIEATQLRSPATHATAPWTAAARDGNGVLTFEATVAQIWADEARIKAAVAAIEAEIKASEA